MSHVPVGRRNFLKRAAVGGAAVLVPGVDSPAAPRVGQTAVAAPRMAPVQARDSDAADTEPMTTDRPGSDFMIDVVKTLGFEYVSANPGSSFRSLHDSIVNYGGNRAPEFITCCHEEASVAMAQGYFKIEGKPMAVLAHGTVGLQHAAMALYKGRISTSAGAAAQEKDMRRRPRWARRWPTGSTVVCQSTSRRTET